MAFIMSSLRSKVAQLGGGRRFIATSTTPKLKPATLHANDAHASNAKTGEWAPVQIVLGMVSVAVALATHTAYQQLVRSPSVNVSKKRRESMSEVDDPDHALSNADKFINRSMLRKVAHIQQNNSTLPDPIRPDPFIRSRTAETLKSAGVEPSRH